MNQQTEDLIQSIKRKIQNLQEENLDLKNARNAYLREKEKDLKLIAELQEEKRTLALQQESSELVGAMSGDTKKLEKDLKKYITMIDKCIATIQSRL